MLQVFSFKQHALFRVAVLCSIALLVSHVHAGDPHYLGPLGVTGDTQAKQIVVSKVDSKSPADGKLQKGDVILKVNGKPFTGDSRRTVAEAIEQVEGEDGKLTLTVKPKSGKQQDITLQLKVLGHHSDTAPFDCAKTDAILDAAVAKMIETESYRDRLCGGWLALMATGDPEHLEIVKRELPKQDFYSPDPQEMDALLRGEIDKGLIIWYLGYQAITLAEYYLLTGDDTALPGLEVITTTLARGQDPAGLWGHRLATDHRGGRLPGYSHINQPSMSCFLGMVLAKKCGINNPQLDQGIADTARFVQRFVERGALPYGNHPPRTKVFNNNGSSSMAGMAMKLIGDKNAAKFFSRQSGASHRGLETGHASYFFNVLWTPLGTNVAGPEMTQAFFDNTNWVYTLYRSWDDQFTFDGGGMKTGNGALPGIMAYSLPRKNLIITGREPDRELWVTAEQAKDIASWDEIDYKSLSDAELIELIGHVAPQVRVRAVWTLRERDPEFLPKIVALLDTGTDQQKESVLGFFGYRCPTEIAEPYIEKIGSILRDKTQSPEVRIAAADALSWHGELAYPYFEDMMKFVMEERPEDPHLEIEFQMARPLQQVSTDAFEQGRVKDKELFYNTALVLGNHPHQNARAAGMTMLRGMPIEDFYIVADTVKHVMQNRDPDYTAYHNPQSSVAGAGMILADFNIQEGMQWAEDMLKTPDGKHSFKLRAYLRVMNEYGPHAKPYVEAIQADPNRIRSMTGGRFNRDWQKLLKASQEDPPKVPPLITFEQARQIGTKN